jgi:hypothetical protein
MFKVAPGCKQIDLPCIQKIFLSDLAVSDNGRDFLSKAGPTWFLICIQVTQHKGKSDGLQ